jgi:hypothetical protein
MTHAIWTSEERICNLHFSFLQCILFLLHTDPTMCSTIDLDSAVAALGQQQRHWTKEAGSRSVGSNVGILLGSTVGSFVDQPSARSPVTESTIERTNTRDIGVRRRRTPARRLRSNGIGELVCAANDRAAFLFSCLAI